MTRLLSNYRLWVARSLRCMRSTWCGGTWRTLKMKDSNYYQHEMRELDTKMEKITNETYRCERLGIWIINKLFCIWVKS